MTQQPIFEHTGYREFIKGTLAERARKNPAYSLRAMARAIGITPMYLSEILRGKKNPSLGIAHQISERLGLEGREAEYFRLLVQLESAKDMRLKEGLLARIREIHPKGQPGVLDLSLEVFRSIAEWHHVAIRNMTELEGFVFNPRNVARRLGITVLEADLAIERLQKLELIEPDPSRPYRYRRTDVHSLAQSAVANTALRSFHRQTLTKAIESLETQSPQEKIVGSLTFAFDPKDLPEADQLFDEFMNKVRKLSERRGSKKTEVYHLGVQFFNLTKPKGRTSK